VSRAVVEADAAIFREGDPAGHLYTVASGAVKLYKSMPDGRRQIVAFALPGDVFGLSAGGSHACAAEALTVSSVCRFRRRQGAAEDALALERRLLDVAERELEAAHRHMLLLGRQTARERVATFLVSMWRRQAVAGDVSRRVPLPMGRADIADHLGLTIETVSRTFSALRREGLIAAGDASQVVILRYEELAASGEVG